MAMTTGHLFAGQDKSGSICISCAQVVTDVTNYSQLYKGLQAVPLPLRDDRCGLVYSPLAVVEVWPPAFYVT